MNNYFKMSKNDLFKEKNELYKNYESLRKLNLNLDISRGKPCKEQLKLSREMLDLVNSKSDFDSENLSDICNYGHLEGIPQIKKLFSEIMNVPAENIFVGGNSSLSLMFDVVSCFFGNKKNIKFLCPSPGYDRHFAICDYFGIKMIPIKMTNSGPNMDLIEKLVADDENICGIWCVPKYSNPTGVTYSDETVKRFANLNTKSENFKIFWDLAYIVHDLTNKSENLKNLFEECKKNNSTNKIIYFCSTSKITFAGNGVSALATGNKTLDILKKMFSTKIINFDKINQLRHVMFLKNIDNIKTHMDKHKKILWPKFKLILDTFEKNFQNNRIISWNTPKGGYFISVETFGSAKRIYQLCKTLGLKITESGATFPYGIDPNDSNLRIAPSFPEINELKIALEIFCTCTKIAAIEKLTNHKII